jgi:hypothetical protein
MSDNPPSLWQWSDWSPDRSNQVARVWLPEAGGWLYRFHNPEGLYSSTFVPDLVTWANAINPPPNAPVAVFSNLAAATTIKQPIPNPAT